MRSANKAAVEWPPMQRGLIGILRGVQPPEVLAIGEALAEAGFGAIEVPLNSPEPFKSIEILATALGGQALIGAGTVLQADDVDRLHAAGGRLMVSPNLDLSVLARCADSGMISMPGVFTPSEALSAIHAGASALKFFPASVLGPDGIKAISAVLPKDTVMGAVGGVGLESFAAYAKAGVRHFGLGSNLYKPGDTAASVAQRAAGMVQAYDTVIQAA